MEEEVFQVLLQIKVSKKYCTIPLLHYNDYLLIHMASNEIHFCVGVLSVSSNFVGSSSNSQRYRRSNSLTPPVMHSDAWASVVHLFLLHVYFHVCSWLKIVH